MLETRVVSSSRDVDEWIAFTDSLYGRTSQFVPPVRKSIRDLVSHKAPVLRHGDVELLSVVRDGTVVGRTTAHTSTKLDAKLGAPLLLFGYTEFVDDEEVFQALVEELDERARRIGAARLFGPVNLLPNQSGGVVTSGYDQRGFVDSPYNHPYYPTHYEHHGFERLFEGETFVLERLGEHASLDELVAFDAERIVRERLEVRRANRRNLKEELPLVREMLNASFAQRAYYTEIDEDEFAYQVDGLAYLLDEQIALYLFKDGKPIGFLLCIPDISEFVRKVNGDLGPLNQLRLLLGRKRYRREAICVIQGIVPEQQGHGYLRLLWRELMGNLCAGGYQTLRGTFVEHANPASSSYAARIGRPAHGVTFYARFVA